MISETVILYTFLPYACFSFLRWVKLCSGCFRQVFFIWETIKVAIGCFRQRWSAYAVTIVWEFTWAGSALIVLDG